jgi:hypothetical protein
MHMEERLEFIDSLPPCQRLQMNESLCAVR